MPKKFFLNVSDNFSKKPKKNYSKNQGIIFKKISYKLGQYDDICVWICIDIDVENEKIGIPL